MPLLDITIIVKKKILKSCNYYDVEYSKKIAFNKINKNIPECKDDDGL